jgi:endonuclease/exonuclease/phosphatase family metal-dependent hydrolase
VSHTPLRIVSYNVRYFGHALKGLASTRGSKRAAAEALSALDPLPDLICLQEVETISVRSRIAFRRRHAAETQLESFMAELEQTFAARGEVVPWDAYYFRAHANRVGNVALSSMGLAILVRRDRLQINGHNAAAPHPITHHHHVQLLRNTKQGRICAHMSLTDRTGKQFHLFNTHLSLPTPFAKEFWTEREKMGRGVNQVHEARTLASFIERCAGSEPFVLCGDFNSPPSSPVYRLLTEERGMQGAQCAVGQIDGAQVRAFPTAGFMRLRMHLDHLFSGNGVRWLDLEGTARFGDRESPFAGVSDHVPLIARFRV